MCIDCVSDSVKEQSSMFNGVQSCTYCQDLSGCMLGLGLLWALPAYVVVSPENMAAML